MPPFLPRHLALILTAAVIFLAGVGAGTWRYTKARDTLRAGLAVKAKRSAAAFDSAELMQLSADPAAAPTLVHAQVKARLIRLRNVESGLRRVYLFRLFPTGEKPALLADSSPVDASGVLGYSPDTPDTPDLSATPLVANRVLAVGETPVVDRFGQWITAYAGIGTPRGDQPRDVLGIDVSAAPWRQSLWSDALSTAGYAWMILLLPLVVFLNSRRQTQQRDALRNLTEAMEQSHSAVIVVDLEGRIEYANAGFCQQIGFTRRELIGRGWREFQGPEVPEALMDDLLATVRAGHSWSGEWLLRRKDATLVPVRGGVTPVKDRAGDTRSYVAVFEDMTEFRQTESVLREAKERAEAGDRAKGQFLATMSHEVRTPLNGIVGFASLLLDTELTPEQQEYVETIRTSSETLIQLTADILDFARIESGRLKLDPQPCDARECVENALDLVAAPAMNKNIELLHWVDDQVPGAIVADVSRLRQVIVNLVNNAVKFTAEGEVEIQTRTLPGDPAPSADGTPRCILEFSVRDTGIGIAAEHHPKIFRPFSQVDDSTTRRYGGTGLGLAICKNIVELMDGQISFVSAPGRGSTFTFSIRVPVHPASVAPRPAPPLAGRRLAIAVPPGGLRRELTRLGGRLGAEVIEVEPAALAQTPDWDLAFMDVTGPMAMALAGSRTPNPALPPEKIVALVPVVLPGELRTALRRHFRLVLNKPLHHDMLFSMLAVPPSSPAAPAPPTALRSSLTAETYNLRVLVVEDNPVNQRLIQKVVANLGCEFSLAANGRAALQELARVTPDVVLMDLHMPELDGLNATLKIRAGEAGAAARHVWIIALTADARQEQRDRTLAAGANDYLTKPVRLPELTAALRRFLIARASAAGPPPPPS